MLVGRRGEFAGSALNEWKTAARPTRRTARHRRERDQVEQDGSYLGPVALPVG
jgi:hypothetical protein